MTSDYDYQSVGWRYQTPEDVTDTQTYDTTHPGYGNQGHTFGDKFNDSERRALIEYLKSL